MRILRSLAIVLAVALPVSGAIMLADARTPAQAERDGFSGKERNLIQQWFELQNTKGKHKVKGKGLPPGIAKNLERGKPLPPGIQMTRLPPALEKKLPPPPSGTERVIIDTNILLIDRSTRLIVDVMREVIDRH